MAAAQWYGCPDGDVRGPGWGYVFRFNGIGWHQGEQLVSPNPVNLDAFFGAELAIDDRHGFSTYVCRPKPGGRTSREPAKPATFHLRMMTQNHTARGLRRLAPTYLSALMIVPVLGLGPSAGPQHVAEGGGARVTALWRSERALDQYAQEGLRIVQGVLAAAGVSAEEGEARPLVSLGLAESPLDLRWLEDPELKSGDIKRRRRRKRAGLDEDEDGGGGEVTASPGQPLVAASVAALVDGGPIIAVAPRVHDRVMFGTGLPPTTRWALALEAARGVAPQDLLGHALSGLAAAKFARSLEQEPFTSSALAELQRELSGASGEARAAHLNGLAALEFPIDRPFDPRAPSVAPVSLMARHALATGMSAGDVLALQPEWVMEAGAIGTHPFGWQAVATRRSDALVLSAEPLPGDAFVLTTTMVLFANDLEVAAQADFVFGAREGSRYLIACNTREGIYVFHRSSPSEDYNAVAEAKEVIPPAGRPVEIKVAWKDHTLVVTVGGVELAGVVLAEDSMAGSFGFGAHAGSTVMLGDVVLN